MKTIRGNHYGENAACRKTNVTFRIIGDHINPADITNKLGIEPHRSFMKGDDYKIKNGGIRQRPTSHWSISSENAIHTTSTEDHAKYIFEILRDKEIIIKKYIENPNISVSIVFWWEAKYGHGGFSVLSDTLGRLCKICNDFDYHFIG